MKKQNTWYMYVLSCSDKSYYCGITTDLDRRLKEHNTTKKGAKYTRSRRPSVLLFFEEYDSRSAASKAESAFKKLTRRKKMEYMVRVCEERHEEEVRLWEARQPKNVD